MYLNRKRYTLLGLLVAMSIVLSYLTLGTGLYKIGLGYIPMSLIGYYFGPYCGALGSLTSHILKSILNPNVPFFPGYIIDALLVGYIYGRAFFNNKITFKRVLISMIIAQFSTAVFLDPLWNTILYKTPLLPQLLLMLIKNSIVVPLYSYITFISMKKCAKLNFFLKQIVK